MPETKGRQKSGFFAEIKQFFLHKTKFSLLFCLVGIFLLPQIGYFTAISPESIIDLTNQERIDSGLQKLTANQLLAKAAYAKAEDILKSQTFQHNINGKKFSSWVKEAGYAYSYTGENLAIDFMTSEGIVDAWMDSPTHKANLLSPDFTEIGVAAIEGRFNNQNSIIVVQMFGNPPMTISRLSATRSNAENADQYLPENLLTHALSKSQNQNLVPDMKEKLDILPEAGTVYRSSVHFGDVYLGNILTPLGFLPLALGMIMSIALAYLYISYLWKIFKSNALN